MLTNKPLKPNQNVLKSKDGQSVMAQKCLYCELKDLAFKGGQINSKNLRNSGPHTVFHNMRIVLKHIKVYQNSRNPV